uniref:Uncharacterized protein n=1 Tax=Strongyloides venezuelensis TaxID=75913 RepID=A0A0K0FJ05_STRVS
MKCSLVKDQLKNEHTTSRIPIDNNLFSDPFHDLNLGVLTANIRLKNILSRTNSRINPCLTIVKKITWNNFINRHRKVHNELIVENNNWIYDQSVMDCDENEQLEDSMEEKIKE